MAEVFSVVLSVGLRIPSILNMKILRNRTVFGFLYFF